jgi:hypothetical protein
MVALRDQKLRRVAGLLDRCVEFGTLARNLGIVHHLGYGGSGLEHVVNQRHEPAAVADQSGGSLLGFCRGIDNCAEDVRAVGTNNRRKIGGIGSDLRFLAAVSRRVHRPGVVTAGAVHVDVLMARALRFDGFVRSHESIRVVRGEDLVDASVHHGVVDRVAERG